MIDMGDWIGELTTTVGTGDLTLGGALEGFARFNVLGVGQVWYTIVDNNNRESGIGTLDGTSLTRDLIHSTLVEGLYSTSGDPMPLSGNSDVYCSFNAAAFNEMNSKIEAFSLNQIGGYTEKVTTSNDIDASITNFVSISDGSNPITVSNVPIGAYTLTIELLASSINLSNFDIKWAGGTPIVPTSDIDLVFLTTFDGNSWLASVSLGYA